MRQWNKKQKIIAAAVFAAVFAIVGAAAIILNRRQTQEGIKHFAVEVTSERDNYSGTAFCESGEEFLGGYLRTMEKCEWQESDYGIYITGFDGMEEDIDNQYWWCVMVNGEPATVGADEIPLQEGDTYSFVLTQGW